MPDPTHRPFTEEQLSERFAPAGTDRATADRRRASYPKSVQAPAEWGAEYALHRDSMNPVMTAAFMRRGRLAHRSPVRPGLFLAGSSTHPGQWVSFAAISGILAAQEAAC